jgi:hypothetical protein
LDIFEALDINGFATQGMKVSGPVSDSVNVSTPFGDAGAVCVLQLTKGATGVLSATTVDKLSKYVDTYAISPLWGLDSLYSGVTNVSNEEVCTLSGSARKTT